MALLERDSELERLGDALHEAAGGRGSALLVEGPAGIGKTSLIEAARRLAADRGFEVLSARGGELERDFAYGVVRQLLEPRLMTASATERAALLDGAAGLAAPLLGLDGALVGGDPGAAALHGLYWLTANLAAEAPLLLCVDDLHWADAASVRFLTYVARRLADLPVLLVAGSRPAVESATPDLVEVAAGEMARLRPAPLSEQAIAELVGDAARAAACRAATGGNPFLVHAALRTLAERSGEPLGGDTVAAATARRLAALGRDAEALARAVAVLGTDVEPRHAQALAGLEPDDAAHAEQALMEAGILAPRRPLEFAHPILRGAVAGRLTPPERATAHLAASRLLAADGADAERLAPHLLAADARGDQWLVETLRAAARRSSERGAPDAAVRYLRRALDEPPGPQTRAAVLAELGRAEVRAALPDDAVAHLRRAFAEEPDPRERAHMLQDLAIGLIAPGRYEEAVELLQEALPPVRESDPELGRRIEAELMCAARLDPRTLPVTRAIYDRLERPIDDGTPGGRMLCAVVALELSMRGGTAAEVRDLAGRAADGGLVAEQTGDSGLVVDAGFALAIAGDFERAERLWEEALEDARRRGSVIGFARCSCIRALLRLDQGALQAAETDARNALERAWEPGYRVARMALAPLVGALTEQGRLDEADAALASAGLDGELPDSFMLNFVLFARGRLRLAQGRQAEGIADLEELGRREVKWRGGNPAVFPYRSLMGDACEEVALARRWGTAGPLGRALRVQGVQERDADLLRESLELLDGSPWRLELAHSLVELGAAVRRAGTRAEARELLHSGMELAHACGAEPLVARAREELAATGARPRRIMRTGVDALTASERRVAELAARGMTNREIAQALFVTVRTVEVHLTHAYQKLDIGSRDALAAVLMPAGAVVA